MQNSVFNIASCLGSLGVLLNDLILLLLKIRHLLRNKLVEHLFFQTKRCDGEVENADFNLSFGSVVRIRDSCSHEELEVRIPWDTLIAES